MCVCVCVCVSVCTGWRGKGGWGRGSDVQDKFVRVNIVYFDVNSSSLIIKYTPPGAHMRKDALGPHKHYYNHYFNTCRAPAEYSRNSGTIVLK